MAEYFIYPDGSMSQIFAENPANPDELDTVKIKKLPAPVQFCIYKDGKVMAIEGILDSLKASARHRINTIRDQYELSVFEFNGVAVDCDPNSRQRIADACVSIQTAIAAGMDMPVIVWTCADNSQLALTASELLQMQVALTQHMQQCHSWAADLKNKIDMAKTEAGINKVLNKAGVE